MKVKQIAQAALLWTSGMGMIVGAGTVPLYGQADSFTVSRFGAQNDGSKIVAPDSIIVGRGTNFTDTTTASTATGPNATDLPVTLGGLRLTFTDSAKGQSNPGLVMVSPQQINFALRNNVALGLGALELLNSPAQASGSILVSNVAPVIFSVDFSGSGVAFAQVQRVSGGVSTFDTTYQGTAAPFTLKTISLNSTDQVFLILYGTGLRRHSLNPVIATIGDINVPVAYAGAQGQYAGLDQINIGPLPQSLRGRGTLTLTLLVDGVPSNPVQVAF